MKKILSMLLLFIVLLSGCSSKSEKSSIEAIKEKGKIVIGTNSGYPPYEYYALVDGKQELVGVDIEIMNMIADDLGVKLEILDMDFDALIPSLQANKFDIAVAGMVNTPKRAKVVDFSTNYNDSKTVGVVLKDKLKDLDSVAKLDGKKIAVQSATTQDSAAKTVKGAEVLSLPAVNDGIMHVKTGKADVLFIAEVSAKSIIEKNEDLVYFELDMDMSKIVDGASIALPKGDKELQEYLNKKINEWKKDGTIAGLFEKYSAIQAVE